MNHAQAQHNTAQNLVVLTAADPNASHGMPITLADVTGTGTYALEDGFPLRFAVVTLGSAQGWGTFDLPVTIVQ